MAGETIAYVRVSTVEQNEERQVEMLKKYGITKWYIDKASGKNVVRTELQKLREFVREGDVVYVVDWSRLSRSVEDLLRLIQEFNGKSVKLISLKENFDTSTSMGKLMITVIGAIYEFQRAYILEAQAEGIEIAKQEGKYKGRKPIEVDNLSLICEKWIKGEITGTQAAELMNVCRTTAYKKLKQYKEEKDNEKDEKTKSQHCLQGCDKVINQ